LRITFKKKGHNDVVVHPNGDGFVTQATEGGMHLNWQVGTDRQPVKTMADRVVVETTLKEGLLQ